MNIDKLAFDYANQHFITVAQNDATWTLKV